MAFKRRKMRRKWRSTGKVAALRAFSRKKRHQLRLTGNKRLSLRLSGKKSGVNGLQPEK